jgi:hypothetical protein
MKNARIDLEEEYYKLRLKLSNLTEEIKAKNE